VSVVFDEMSKRDLGDKGWRRAKLRDTALWTKGDQVYDWRIGEVEREGQIDRMRGEPNRLEVKEGQYAELRMKEGKKY